MRDSNVDIMCSRDLCARLTLRILRNCYLNILHRTFLGMVLELSKGRP